MFFVIKMSRILDRYFTKLGVAIGLEKLNKRKCVKKHKWSLFYINKMQKVNLYLF